MNTVYKYKTRGLYFAEKSCNVTKKILCEWYEAGVDFQVLDQVTGEDLTDLYEPDENFEPFDPDPMTTRKCRVCKECLPTSRYFRHIMCDSEVQEMYSGKEYGHIGKIMEGGSGYKVAG